jgi:hypothetical protein
MIGWVKIEIASLRNGLTKIAALGPTQFNGKRCCTHHDRQMDRDQQKNRHPPGIAIGGENERDADKNGVRLRGGKPGHRAGWFVASKPTRDDQMRARPNDDDGCEIDRPIGPGRCFGHIGGGQRLEQQTGHRDGKHEIRQPIANMVLDEAGACGGEADGDETENRENDGEKRHAPPWHRLSGGASAHATVQ